MKTAELVERIADRHEVASLFARFVDQVRTSVRSEFQDERRRIENQNALLPIGSQKKAVLELPEEVPTQLIVLERLLARWKEASSR